MAECHTRQCKKIAGCVFKLQMNFPFSISVVAVVGFISTKFRGVWYGWLCLNLASNLLF